MSITASDVAKLRSATGAGMMDCKKALEEANGDQTKAAEILRKKGVVKAAKRADKVAAEGLIFNYVSGDKKTGVLLELNCETDFVADNADFVNFGKELVNLIVNNKPADTLALASLKVSSGETVEVTCKSLIAKIGENITIRRFVCFESTGAIATYLHGTKIGVLVDFNPNEAGLGTDVAMQVAASNPKYLDRTVVPTEVVDKEKEIYSEQLKQQGKPQNIVDNILKGKLEKFYEETCLVDQIFIKDESKKIKDMLAQNKVGVSRFARYELGEGIEKVEKNFADEVAEQLGQK